MGELSTQKMVRYSVIIPTYNRSALLEECLVALACQTALRDSYEVIVVNDGSSDDTPAVVERAQKTYPHLILRYFAQRNCGPSRARNRGIAEARGEILFFTDDDCIAPPGWIETLAAAYETHPEIAGAGGWYEYSGEAYRKNPFVAYTTDWFEIRYQKDVKRESAVNSSFLENPAGNTSNMSYRKSVLKEVGGFDEAMAYPGFDDWELKKRVLDKGYPLAYVTCFVLHRRPLGVFSAASRLFHFGRGRYHFIMLHPDLAWFYYPSWTNAVGTMRSSRRYLYIALASFIFTRLGWEYQKRCERRKQIANTHV